MGFLIGMVATLVILYGIYALEKSLDRHKAKRSAPDNANWESIQREYRRNVRDY